MPIGVIIVISMSIIIAVRIRSLRQKEAAVKEDFWKRERDANLAANRDISNLSYITIPLDKLPFDSCTSSIELDNVNRIRDLSNKKLLNLNQKTNTQLKEEYGPRNLSALTEIGENFVQLEEALYCLGKARYEEGDYEHALSFLEYAASIKSGMNKNYTLLGDCYHALGQDRKIEHILEMLPLLNLTMEDQVREHLNELLFIHTTISGQ